VSRSPAQLALKRINKKNVVVGSLSTWSIVDPERSLGFSLARQAAEELSAT
jgi:hypothetical protein